MTADLLLALIAFAFVTSVTPGPNNMMLLASGVNFGFCKSIPHMLGIGVGFGFMLLMVGLGIGQVFVQFPQAYTALKVISVIYMLWLASKIANAGPVKAADGQPDAKPMTFLQGAAFQWVNPKAWTMSLTAMSAYTVPSQYFISVAIVALVFTLINLPTVSSGPCSALGYVACSPTRCG